MQAGGEAGSRFCRLAVGSVGAACGRVCRLPAGAAGLQAAAGSAGLPTAYRPCSCRLAAGVCKLAASGCCRACRLAADSACLLQVCRVCRLLQCYMQGLQNAVSSAARP